MICCGRGGEISTNRREEVEMTALCLRILQAALVYVNTLMLQDVLADEAWSVLLGEADRRGLTPLFWQHVRPYGEVRLDMMSRLRLSQGQDPRGAAAGCSPRSPDHFSVLGDFRERLVDGRADRLLDLALARLKEAGLVRERTAQRTDSTHVLAAVRDLTRLELVTEAVRAALEEVARTAGDALEGLIDDEWGRRYGRPVRLGKNPTRPKTRMSGAGADARLLLEHLAASFPNLLRGPQAKALRQAPAQGQNSSSWPPPSRRCSKPVRPHGRRAESRVFPPTASRCSDIAPVYPPAPACSCLITGNRTAPPRRRSCR